MGRYGETFTFYIFIFHSRLQRCKSNKSSNIHVNKLLTVLTSGLIPQIMKNLLNLLFLLPWHMASVTHPYEHVTVEILVVVVVVPKFQSSLDTIPSHCRPLAVYFYSISFSILQMVVLQAISPQQ